MEFTYRIEKSEKIVYLEGDVSNFKQWKQTLLTLFADSNYERGFNFLSDRRLIEKPRSTEFIRSQISFLKEYTEQIEGCKWATVVSSTAAFGMGRMAQILSEDIPAEMQVFTDMDEARQWLTGARRR
jgi:hypothetical protein